MVPNGWSVFPLDQVSKIIDCKHRTPKYVKEGIPLVSPGTIKWGPIDLDSPTKRVTNEEYTSLMDHCSVDIGDLVLSRNQSVGIASYVDKSEPFVLGQDTVLVKPNGCDASYLFYNLQSVNTQRTVFKLAGGSTFSRINLGEIRKLRSIYPPLPEQRKIAQILSTWDRGIAITEKLIDASKQQKKALMQQLLTGKKRLVNPETGKAFEGEWEELRLGELGKIVSGGTPSTSAPECWDGDIDWATPTDITKLRTRKIRDTARKITALGLSTSSAKLVPAGTLLVCTRATIGALAISQQQMCTNQGFKNLIPNKNVDVDFLYYLVSYGKHKLVSKASGSTFLELSKKDFEHIRFKIPKVDEQQKIASVLTAADKEIELLNAKLTHLKQEKKALMQQLLTGKCRVKV
ncbi:MULTISPECIES: restriction endonuclease subunit S [Vibrio harveyi group]|uniref:restriction endonuclease subunit S n=1 Tax=Vibrio harveyi group TaxID=717610 RepID=UPI00215F467D|nr:MULTISPECIES: restriction endonuclease subunit S [Vibrio harveyi group]EIV8494014.1 restriction endonuclease subunit S [Vibrio vulnificus]MCS0254111.1 restriction endonuclease subunit S [Vibrio alginolyticus]